MSWVTIIWSMIASASLTLAAMHLLVWCKKRLEWASLFFSMAAAAIAAIAFCELSMMRAETPEQFGTAVRWLHVPIWVMLVAIVGFVRIRLRAGRMWLAWGVCAMRTFSLLLNFVTGQNLSYRQITALKHVRFFGESVSVADGVSNPWMLIGQLSLLLFVVFVTDATITVWRRGERRQAMATGGAIAFFALAGTVQVILITWHIVQIPLTVSLFYMGFIAVVACEMSSEIRRAMILSTDLRDSEERLNLATGAAGVGLWSMDLKTHRVWVTPKLRELFNFASDREINYEGFFRIIHPEDNKVVHRTVDHALQRKEGLHVDYRVVLPNGEIRWICIRGRPYLDSSGELVRLMGVALDITERMQQEESLRLSQARVSSAIDIAGLGFYESGENGRLAFMDDRVRALLGLPPEEEPCGREYWLAHIHPEDLPQVLQVSAAILGGHLSSHAMEYRYGHPSRGILWFRHLSRVLERDTAGRSMRTIGVVWDITERKRNEMELLESRGALRTFASRLLTIQDEERRRLARELHDDFTQRLAVLAMEISTIETSAGSAKANPLPALKRIREQIVKLSSDIHDISRQLHPSIIDDLGLTRAIQSECGNFTRRTGIAVSCESISIPSTIPRDVSVGLFRIAQEALRNVEKHARVKEADVLLAGSGESITLTIHDSGTGFDPASAGQSHGLGLFSMKERAQLINGLFSLDSAPGQGTLIRVAVPLEGIEHG